MRKFCGRFAVLFLLTAALCCVSALAVDEGIVVDSANLTGILSVTARKANGDEITSQKTIDGKQVYLDAERITMTLENATADQNLIIVSKGEDFVAPTEVNIVYIDQQPGGSDVSFEVFPKSLSKGTYTVWLADSNNKAEAVGSFDYYAPYTMGDVNGDNKIGTTDVLWILQYMVEKRELDDTQKLAANVNKDVDKDGNMKIGTTDTLWILQAAASSRIF